ncbi:MAG: 2-dehydro-3-deoxygalactonokinase [Ferruginibacter sp.]
MKYFFSCDWGTSSFRLRLVETVDAKVASTIQTNHGIANIFGSWKQANLPEEQKIAWYKCYLAEQVEKITSTYSDQLGMPPVVLSGMVSSSIGMLELPYQQMPFACNGSGLLVHKIKGGPDLQNDMIIISGVKSDDDVIRGEESMLVGCDLQTDDTEQLLIFPGTHSKHIKVKNGVAYGIKTFMTGEIFQLISDKSILANSITKDDDRTTNTEEAFAKGVKEGSESNLLNNIFHVRTNQLFKKMNPYENYHYLSGLLIGYELQEIANSLPFSITLVCSESFKLPYLQALEQLALGITIHCIDADASLVKGQLKILEHLQHKL